MCIAVIASECQITTAVTNACPGETLTGSVVVTVTPTAPGNDYIVSLGADSCVTNSSCTFSGVQVGNHPISVITEGGGGCSGSVTVSEASISIFKVAATDSNAQCNEPCNGQMQGIVDTNASGYTANIVGTNTGYTASTFGLAGVFQFNGLCPDIYQLTVVPTGCN